MQEAHRDDRSCLPKGHLQVFGDSRLLEVEGFTLGNDVCNYCATREARKYANHIEVFLAASLQVSTLDAVTGNLAEDAVRSELIT